MASLLVIRGPLTGARIQLSGDMVSIGRSPEATISLPDAAVSRTHAILRKQRLGWLLEDDSSSAGTFLNNLEVQQPTPLSPNDEVRVGHSIFLFDTEFDLQNADFTDNSVYLSSPHEDTMALSPVATLDSHKEKAVDSPAGHGLELLSEIGDLFDSTKVPFGEALRATMERMSRMLQADVALLMLYDNATKQLRASAAIAKGDVLADGSVMQRVYGERKALLLSDKPELVEHPAPDAPQQPKVRSVAAAPLVVDDACIGVVYFERQELDAYSLKDLRLVQSLGRLLAVFIEARQKAEMTTLRANYTKTDSSLLGNSPSFRRTLDMLRRMAETPSTVLLVGETGTGKEMLAAEVHRLSPQGRDGGPFIAVNCAAIPESLFESELFGHEKGSFTGAYKMRQGYIEQAQGGTLFLDEIGELSIMLQPKLLRFLQEHTFTRVGGNRLHRAEVRVVAATNRDLLEEVRQGRFREDLYHRVSVLPIHVPPLRERREDIRLLAEYHVQLYSKSLHRDVVGISDEAMIQLEKYEWPGNVRELSNCVERAVLLCDSKVLLPRHFSIGHSSSAAAALPMIELPRTQTERAPAVFRRLEEIEKEYVLKVMAATKQNQMRTAEILGIHRNTLRKKLQDWGV